MEVIRKYFPHLTEVQSAQLKQLTTEVLEWNTRINLISRKDTDQVAVHHILHSLVIAKFITFSEGSAILDLGTGGGFPGLPLAILFPECVFLLVDARGKKIKAVNAMIESLGLENVEARHVRAEELREHFDFVVTRAVAPLNQLMQWTARRYSRQQRNALPNGLIALKGGDLTEELKEGRKLTYVDTAAVHDYFDEPYFDDKHIVYAQSAQS